MKNQTGISEKARFIFLAAVILLFTHSTFADYSGGSGAPENPYQIATAEDLLTLAANTDDYGKCFILTADIDLSPALLGNPVFTTAVIAPDTDSSNVYFDGVPFTGVFDGAGHTIYNLTINTNGEKSNYIALIGCIGGFTEMGGEIKNLTLQNVNISAGPYSERVAALVGENDAGIITNCLSTGFISGANDAIYIGGLIGMDLAGDVSFCRSSSIIIGDSNTTMLGGLVGDGFESRISDCSATGLISGTSDCWYLGGLIGYATSCNIEDSYATGEISTADRPYCLGGLAGSVVETSITHCLSTGNVYGVSAALYLGGLVGENAAFSTISECYATGDVTGVFGSDSLGGLVGYNTANCTNCFASGDITGGFGSWAIAGLVGSNDEFEDEVGIISKCYSRGTVTGDGDESAAGLVGQKYAGTVSDCYFLITAGPDNGCGVPLTDNQMRQQSSFVDWDFVNETANGTEDVWSIIEGVDYPRLAKIWESLENYPLSSIKVEKCTVKAGKKPNTDKIFISGKIDATDRDFKSAGCVKVTIDSDAMPDPFVKAFSINKKTFINSQFTSSVSGSEVKSFKYNVKTGKFAFTADKTDLTGLACPMTVNIEIGNYIGEAELYETIVNGPKKLIPIELLMGAKNSFRIDKFKVKRGKKYLYADRLSVKGEFSVKDLDVNMVKNDFVLTLGTQSFTLRAGTFDEKSINFVCVKRGVVEGGIASASFDFDKCAFSITIKNAWINLKPGPAGLNINFASFNDTESVEVVLP